MANQKAIRSEQILMALGRKKLLEQIDIAFDALNAIKTEFGVESTIPYIAKAMGYEVFDREKGTYILKDVEIDDENPFDED